MGILVLEMFFWDHPVGRKAFAMTPEQSARSAVLAMNQGLYNGFLAAGPVWGLVAVRKDGGKTAGRGGSGHGVPAGGFQRAG